MTHMYHRWPRKKGLPVGFLCCLLFFLFFFSRLAMFKSGELESTRSLFPISFTSSESVEKSAFTNTQLQLFHPTQPKTRPENPNLTQHIASKVEIPKSINPKPNQVLQPHLFTPALIKFTPTSSEFTTTPAGFSPTLTEFTPKLFEFTPSPTEFTLILNEFQFLIPISIPIQPKSNRI